MGGGVVREKEQVERKGRGWEGEGEQVKEGSREKEDRGGNNGYERGM